MNRYRPAGQSHWACRGNQRVSSGEAVDPSASGIMTVHLLKLCVGADDVEDLLDWQAERPRRRAGPRRRCTSPGCGRGGRRSSSRAAALLGVPGLVLARQRVLRLDRRVGEDGIVRCAIVLDRTAVRVRPQPRRPFQGWRYLRPEEAPADLDCAAEDGRRDLPTRLLAELAERSGCARYISAPRAETADGCEGRRWQGTRGHRAAARGGRRLALAEAQRFDWDPLGQAFCRRCGRRGRAGPGPAPVAVAEVQIERAAQRAPCRRASAPGL
jgi:hypothetical protein